MSPFWKMECDHETQTPVAFTSPSKFLQPELTDHTSKHFYFYRVHQLYVIQNKFLGSSALHLLKIRPLNLDLILVTRSCNSIATGSYRLNWRYKTLFWCYRFQNHDTQPIASLPTMYTKQVHRSNARVYSENPYQVDQSELPWKFSDHPGFGRRLEEPMCRTTTREAWIHAVLRFCAYLRLPEPAFLPSIRRLKKLYLEHSC